MIFRGIQELMGHARDYANANEISIRLDIGNNVVKVIVDDNGRGFDTNQLFPTKKATGPAPHPGLDHTQREIRVDQRVGGLVSGETDSMSVRIELPTSD